MFDVGCSAFSWGIVCLSRGNGWSSLSWTHHGKSIRRLRGFGLRPGSRRWGFGRVAGELTPAVVRPDQPGGGNVAGGYPLCHPAGEPRSVALVMKEIKFLSYQA